MINQNFENINQSGTSQVIEANVDSLNFTELQGYCIIFGFFITVCVIVICIKDVIKHITNKTCIGCKRLENLEKVVYKNHDGDD